MLFKKKPTNQPRARQPLKTGGSTPVFSYHASSTRREQPTGTRRASKLLWVAAPGTRPTPSRPSAHRNLSKRAFVIVLAIVGTALAVNSLMLNRDPEVIALADSNSRRYLLHSQETYYEAARSILGSSLANTNKLTVNTDKIAAEIRRQFPELEEVSVALPLVGHQPVIYLQPAEPALLLRSAGDVLVVSSSGQVLAETANPARLAKLGLVVVEDQSGLALKPGTSALPGADVAFITEVVGQLRAKKLTLTALTLPRGASELDIRLKGDPYIVKFNLRGDARAEAGSYLAVRQYLKRTRQTPSSYIDVRVENKVYYR